MHFDLTDLRLFLHIHDTGSITAGAARMPLTLASASTRVQAMEAALGTPLLVRERRGVRATPAGLTLADHARRVLAQVDLLRGEMAQHSGGPKGHVRLLANTSAATAHLPGSLARFLAAHPGYSLDMEERASDQIADALRQARADLGVMSDAADAAGLQCAVWRADPLVLVTPRGHALAGRRRVWLEDVVDEPFLGLHEHNALQALVTAQARRLGRALPCRVRLGSLEAVCRMVGRGAGVAIVPRAVAEREARGAGLRRVALGDAWAARQLVVYARRWTRCRRRPRAWRATCWMRRTGAEKRRMLSNR